MKQTLCTPKNHMYFNSKIDSAVPVVLYKWHKEKKASAFLNLTLTTKIRGFSLSYMVTRDISHCMDREWDVWETFFWTFQFSIFIISQKKEREKNVICSSVAAYITCAIELILMGVLVDTVEQMSNSRVTIFSNLYCGYSSAVHAL